MPDALSVREHEVLQVTEQPTTKSVSPDEAERLALLGRQRPGFCTRGHRTVRLANYAGLVNLGGRMLEVLPKVETDDTPVERCRGVLLRLLHMAEGLRVHVGDGAGHGLQHRPLLDVFVSVFFDEVALLIRGGLLRRYREQEEDLSLIRGRLAIQRQIAVHAMRPDRLACRFDELTADNDWNRVLRAALRLLKPWMRTLRLRRRWAELWPAFHDVADLVRVSDVFDRLSPDRQVARYGKAVQWARRIVDVLSPNLRVGEAAAPSLLFDTNRLFELAVARRVKSGVLSSESNRRVRTQVGGAYLAKAVDSAHRQVGLRPDLVIEDSGRVTTIADTKWKRLSTRNGYLDPEPADVYQMLAYAARFKCADLALIYPWHTGLEDAQDTVLELPELAGVRPRISIVCMDVGADGLPARLVGKFYGIENKSKSTGT